MSENESLVLWKVTEDHAGVYKLTVNAGYKTLHKDFVIHVLATTTILRTGEPPHSVAAFYLFVSYAI